MSFKRSRIRVRLVVLLAASAVLSASALPSFGAGKDDLTVVLKDKVIRDLSSAGLTLVFRISVSNNTSSDRELVRTRYRFTVNQKEFLNLDVGLNGPFAVPAGRETLIALPVKITYSLLFASAGPIENKALCDLVGDFVFQDARKRQDKVPFAFPGEFPIFKDPELEFLPLKINDLTVGGADLVFRMRLRNPNNYELLIERISYHLFFGATEVLSGDIPGDKSVPAAGDRTFELPFLLDFFEAGTGLREEFKKPALPCRLTGDVVISSVWGPLEIRLDKSQDLGSGKTF